MDIEFIISAFILYAVGFFFFFASDFGFGFVSRCLLWPYFAWHNLPFFAVIHSVKWFNLSYTGFTKTDYQQFLKSQNSNIGSDHSSLSLVCSPSGHKDPERRPHTDSTAALTPPSLKEGLFIWFSKIHLLVCRLSFFFKLCLILILFFLSECSHCTCYWILFWLQHNLRNANLTK